MTADQLQDRTFGFAVQTVRLCRSFPRTTDGYVFARQLLRSATSVGANYRAVRRSRSGDEFISKLGIVIEEADEAHYWLTLAVACGLTPAERAEVLIREAAELLAIFVKSRSTARQNASARGGRTKNPNPQITNPQITNPQITNPQI